MSWVAKRVQIKSVLEALALNPHPAYAMQVVRWADEPAVYGNPVIDLDMIEAVDTTWRPVLNEDRTAEYQSSLIDFRLQVMVRTLEGVSHPSADDVTWRIIRRMRQPDIKELLRVYGLAIEITRPRVRAGMRYEIDGYNWRICQFELHMRTEYSVDEDELVSVEGVSEVEASGEASGISWIEEVDLAVDASEE
jgi:hypothetical protein